MLVFTNTSCPLVQRYLPVLQALDKEYRGKDVQFVAINSAEEDTLIAMATQAVKFDIEFPFVKDFDASCAAPSASRERPRWWSSTPRSGSAIAAASTTSIAFARHPQGAAPTRDLKDALDAVLAGKPGRHARDGGGWLPRSPSRSPASRAR